MTPATHLHASHFHPSYQAGAGWNLMLEPRQAHTTPPQARRFDVIVVGAGFTGLAAARRIAQLEPHSSILVVDATTVGDGSSGRNSGFLINLPHNTGMSGHGSEAEIARKQIALYDAGLASLHGIVTAHNIECGWNPAGKYHAAATDRGAANLESSLQHYRDWGVEYTALTADELRETTGSGYYKSGYHSAHNVFVQPAALIRGLADTLPGNVRLWEGEPVLALSGDGPYQLRTVRRTLRADRIVIANNGFASKLGLARDRVLTIYTYAALTPVLDPGVLRQFGRDSEWGIIPANRLGTTLRRTADGRFMVRSDYSYETEKPLTAAAAFLQDAFQRRYPELASHEFEYVWGGVTALTANGALYFGEVRKNLFVSVGCNGAGVLKGSTFGGLLGEMACGLQSPALADALGFQRPSWLPPEPVRRAAVLSAISWQKHQAGMER